MGRQESACHPQGHQSTPGERQAQSLDPEVLSVITELPLPQGLQCRKACCPGAVRPLSPRLGGENLTPLQGREDGQGLSPGLEGCGSGEMSPGLSGRERARAEIRGDGPGLLARSLAPTLFTAHAPRTLSWRAPPFSALPLLSRLPGMSPPLPASRSVLTELSTGRSLEKRRGPRSGHVLWAFLDEGGQVSTEEDPLQVTSETESEPHSGHAASSS